MNHVDIVMDFFSTEAVSQRCKDVIAQKMMLMHLGFLQ